MTLSITNLIHIFKDFYAAVRHLLEPLRDDSKIRDIALMRFENIIFATLPVIKSLTLRWTHFYGALSGESQLLCSFQGEGIPRSI